MTEQDFKEAIKDTLVFNKHPIFKKNILLRYRVPALYDYYLQAKRHGIEYLKQNPNILTSEVKLINEIITKL